MTTEDFGILYKKHLPYFTRVVNSYVSTEDDRNELLQIGCMRALRNLHNYNEEGYFPAWFAKILYSGFIDRYRKIKKLRGIILEDIRVNRKEGNEYSIKEVMGIHSVNPDHFIEKEFYDLCNDHLSYKEQELMHNMINIPKQLDIADEMDINRNTLVARVRRLRNKIRNNPELMRHLI